MLLPVSPSCYTRGYDQNSPSPIRVPDSVAPSTEDAELRAHVEQALSATYEVDQEIGRGGMGIVYRARDKRLKRHVAIKLLPPELSFRRDIRSRFLREAETAAQLTHPHIVPIYSVDEVGNLVFFVMACIDGDNLATRLQKRGPLPIEEVRRWLIEVADALAYAHSRGVIHRDIKPDNILLDSIDGRALVTDFGIARAASDSGETSRLTATGMAIGTPAYMSPEQASGDRDLDARSDLYSLGIVAYQMLCGEPPFTGNTTPALLVKHLAEMPVPIAQRRSDVPPDLALIVMRLLEKNPDHRFQLATELVTALRTGIVPPGHRDAPTSGGTSPVTFNGAPIGGMPLGNVGAAGNSGRAGNPAYSYQAPSYQARTAAQPSVSPAAPASPYPAYGDRGDDVYVPTGADLARWEAKPVMAFRGKLAPYLFVNGAILVVSIFGGKDFLGLTTLWTVYIAWKYAKLWSEGFDWKDVLRQPRHRLLGEVFSDLGDNFLATFSRKKREELRAQGRLRNRLDGSLTVAPIAMGTTGMASGTTGAIARATAPARDDDLGEYLTTVRSARSDREEIVRLFATLPQEERARMPDVSNTATDLSAKIEMIAADLARIDHKYGAGVAERMDTEIAALEAEANPLEVERSETRVRRLAQLRRDRRAMAEAVRKRDTRRGQLESCRLALENVRLDLVRLRTGNSSVQSVTLIAEQAMALARDVEIAVQAANEVRDVTRSRSGVGSA